MAAELIRSGRHGIHPERDANYELTKYCYGRATAYVANNKRPRCPRVRDVVRDGNKYPPLPLLRFTLRKLKNASAAEYRTRIALSRRSLVYHFVRAIVVSRRVRSYFLNQHNFLCVLRKLLEKKKNLLRKEYK